jgi:hypothetical protein
MNQHLLVKIPALRVRRSGIFPTQLNDSELIRGSLRGQALLDHPGFTIIASENQIKLGLSPNSQLNNLECWAKSK